ncbi:electron transfer flavoprotein subunit alpha/FixB family protein [Pseudothermotoga thermarum]|uniref:Electron transfer flavoprotein alpha subunit n=1 Tax=Pseudothermotoga thermarum DSM 5069 TaxID=688269 RepID=F7YVE0_9THEM|nr:electron transfer flavoprotein subunit alpha/FixB family protein [Pseudothermotoga thermarum]AEH50443.1 Electron transfer flavoprotein alpha subunit [Pseudothermotoga thermarum DSM 5069]
MLMVISNKVDRNTIELLSKACELANRKNFEVSLLLMSAIQEKLEQLKGYADNVILMISKQFEVFSLDPFLVNAEMVVRKYRPEIILSSATTFGRTLMPALAAKLKTGLTADCTELDIDEKGNLLQTRPAIGGNVMATIVTSTRPQMATVRPKVFQINPPTKQKTKFIFEQPIFVADRCELIGYKVREEEAKIEEADVIISVGKGLRRKENLDVVYKLAKFVNGAVGATRAVVEAKWLSFDHQIGLSGKVVKPKIYIAAGISGAVQHLAGMQTSQTIIAINKDRYAPIFKVADIGIVADAYSILQQILEALGDEKNA